jgi:hypothetical protein
MPIAPAEKGLEVFEKVPIRRDVDLSVEVREPAYMDKAIFSKYIHELFFPLLDAERKGAEPCDNPAVIFCDNLQRSYGRYSFARVCRTLGYRDYVSSSYVEYFSSA